MQYVIQQCAEWKDDAYFRDHWLQAVYPLSAPVRVPEDGIVILRACQDEFGFWFDPHLPESPAPPLESPPNCDCGLHLAYSSRRIWTMNDIDRQE